jgi:hypothetical protein
MHIPSTFTLLSGFLVTSAFAVPTFKARDLSPLEDVLFMDGLAYQNPNSPEETLASLQSFVFVREIGLGPLKGIVSDAFEAIGLDIGDQIESVLNQLSLFAAIGLGGKELDITLEGCSPTSVSLEETEGLGSDLGIVVNDALPLGNCGEVDELIATTRAKGFFEPRTYTSRIFSSDPDGFGVISGKHFQTILSYILRLMFNNNGPDIDDTVKVSHVLDKLALVKATSEPFFLYRSTLL